MHSAMYKMQNLLDMDQASFLVTHASQSKSTAYMTIKKKKIPRLDKDGGGNRLRQILDVRAMQVR